MQDTEQGPTSSPEAAMTIFEEPSLSRQWVVRRLQRALTVERWAGPARDGLAHGADRLRPHGQTSADRAELLESLIREVGSEPYPSYGIAAPMTRFATGIVGRLCPPLARRAGCFLATYTMAEYRALTAFVEGAPGVPGDLMDRVTPLEAQTRGEFDDLGCS
jgi:hypothetical protein